MNIRKKGLYFFTSMAHAGLKTVGYSFTFPSSVRKVLEKSDSYKSHKDTLMKIAEKRGQRESAKTYVDMGDLVGFFGGLSGIVWYATEATQHPDMIMAWLVANGLSLAYEVARGADKYRKSK